MSTAQYLISGKIIFGGHTHTAMDITSILSHLWLADYMIIQLRLLLKKDGFVCVLNLKF